MVLAPRQKNPAGRVSGKRVKQAETRILKVACIRVDYRATT